MSDEHTSEPETDETPGSVFGNLPGSRPGTRSPRRDRGKAAEAKAKPAKAKAKEPAAKAKKPAEREPEPPPQREPEPPPEREPDAPAPAAGGGLEDIAWAGVAAAAEAATLGVRLASRAIEALRGNSQERDD
jgi:hypothetical protein